MALANDFAQSLKLQADIVRIVGDYVSLKKAGAQNYSGLCPFHKEKTPSFSVHATRQFYHCFGCGVSGDVFTFVQKIENITFPEAIRAVAQKMGVSLPKQTFSSEAEAKDARLRTVLLEIHERACGFFQECLRRPEGARAREYLAGRGLNEDTTAISRQPSAVRKLQLQLRLGGRTGLRRRRQTAGPSTPPDNPQADHPAPLGMTGLRRVAARAKTCSLKPRA